MDLNFEEIIKETFFKVKNMDDSGKTASYIPELALIDSENFGVHITTINQDNFGIGDCYKKFSIQSIAKVLALSLAYKLLGDKNLAKEKVLEEINELTEAVEENSNKIHEAADVLYHLMMYLEANDIKIEEIMAELSSRKK